MVVFRRKKSQDEKNWIKCKFTSDTIITKTTINLSLISVIIESIPDLR